jgi:hypothetical protein
MLWDCIAGTAPDVTHDPFEWWAYIWIPLLLGAANALFTLLIGGATVLVSIVALVSSARATRLAHEVEQQRQAAASERERDERRRQVQAMAVEQAQALTYLALVAMENPHWRYQEPKVGEPHGPALEKNARVLMQQSLVPGAEELFKVTEFELDNFWRLKPDAIFMPDRIMTHPTVGFAKSAIISEAVPAVRRDRINKRIRRWALDPEEATPSIRAELAQIENDPRGFMDYRRGLANADLPPLDDLPTLPHETAERLRILREYGAIPLAADSATPDTQHADD